MPEMTTAAPELVRSRRVDPAAKGGYSYCFFVFIGRGVGVFVPEDELDAGDDLVETLDGVEKLGRRRGADRIPSCRWMLRSPAPVRKRG